MKVLITGGAGYIGSLLCNYLLSNGYKVTVIDSFLFSQNSLNSYYNNKNFNVISMDVRDKELNHYVKKHLRNKSTSYLPSYFDYRNFPHQSFQIQ